MRVTDAKARVLAACAGLLLAAPALAQSPGYPDRPVKIIVPFAAAGPTATEMAKIKSSDGGNRLRRVQTRGGLQPSRHDFTAKRPA